MRPRLAAAAPLLLGGAYIAAFFGHLLSPRAVLAARDVPFLHLPLRTAFGRLAEGGLPSWNPLIHGGQPILSNPHYAAFYPPTWLGLAAAPHAAINLSILLHAGLAFAGAWSLARHLGCRRAAAAVAALAYAGSGTYVSLTSTLLLFSGMAWLPWILRFGDTALRRRGPSWIRPAVVCGLLLGLQILNGDPASTTVTGLALLLFATAAEGRQRRSLLRLLAPLALGVAVAAVQILPTWQRLADSPRAGGLPLEEAGVWSTRPVRLVEVFFPRAFGDVTRDEENLYFGWGLHDKDYPFLMSLYPGLLAVALGIPALLAWPIPRRRVWLLAAGIGAFLALGRHNPVFPLLHGLLPGLAMVRYPEKFLLLTAAALAFSGALGWEVLLAGREEEAGRRRSRAPLLLAAVLGAVAAGLAAALFVAPGLGVAFLRSRSGLPPSPLTLARGLAFLRGEAAAAFLTAAGVAGLLLLYRRLRTPAAALAMAAVAFLGVDLWHYGHRFNPTLPASRILSPPPLARSLQAADHRIFSNLAFDERPEVGLRIGEPGFYQLLTRIARLDPYSGNLWGLAYALHEDYDLMMTGWARHALDLLHQEWDRPARARRLLGAWNVGTLVIRRSAEEMFADLKGGEPEPAPARLEGNPYLLPRFRLVPEVELHADLAAAVDAARAGGFRLGERDHWVAPGGQRTRQGAPAGELGTPAERGGRIALPYRLPAPGFLVAAITFDDGWEASVAGSPVPTYPTAAGQLGLELPAGSRRLELRYRDPWVEVGAFASAVGLLAAALLGLRSRPP